MITYLCILLVLAVYILKPVEKTSALTFTNSGETRLILGPYLLVSKSTQYSANPLSAFQSPSKVLSLFVPQSFRAFSRPVALCGSHLKRIFGRNSAMGLFWIRMALCLATAEWKSVIERSLLKDLRGGKVQLG